jgi:hypothetical protein
VRLTCLKCGHQIELATYESIGRLNCICGEEYTQPHVLNTGIRPNERAAERSRLRAFRAAGLVKDLGGFALGISALGVIFFPLGLLGAAIGIYVLTMRGPMSRYSGRSAAVGALALGASVFVIEGFLLLDWVHSRRQRQVEAIQYTAGEDLRDLLRAERLFHATRDRYGSIKELGFVARNGHYTIYLAPDDFLSAQRNGQTIKDALPDGLVPGLSEEAFTAVAVGNLDTDPDVDVWVLTDSGRVSQVASDLGSVMQ